MLENMVNFVSLAQLLYFICWEVSSLIRSNAVWNTMTVNKSFFKSTVWQKSCVQEKQIHIAVFILVRRYTFLVV